MILEQTEPAACDFTYLTHLRSGDHSFFVDQFNRALILHGINVSGTCKLPATNYPASIMPDDEQFWNKNNSFVNRPFDLQSAPAHFQRLKDLGFSLIRLVVTWEALEHEGPGVYDKEYMHYISELCQIAGDYGLLVFIDSHQDCWSRFTGGSG